MRLVGIAHRGLIIDLQTFLSGDADSQTAFDSGPALDAYLDGERGSLVVAQWTTGDLSGLLAGAHSDGATRLECRCDSGEVVIACPNYTRTATGVIVAVGDGREVLVEQHLSDGRVGGVNLASTRIGIDRIATLVVSSTGATRSRTIDEGIGKVELIIDAVAPDVVGQLRIVDEWIAVLLLAIDAFVADNLPVGHRVGGIPLEQEVEQPRLDGGIVLLREGYRLGYVGVGTPGCVGIAGSDVEVDASEVALVVVAGFEDHSVVFSAFRLTYQRATIVELDRRAHETEGIVALGRIGVDVGRIDVEEVGVAVADRSTPPPRLWTAMLLVGTTGCGACASEIIDARGIVVEDLVVGTRDDIGEFVMVPKGTIVEDLVHLDDLLQGDLETLSAELAGRVVVPLGHLALLGIASLGNDEKHCPRCCYMSDVT